MTDVRHAHFRARVLSRRQFLETTAGVTGLALGASLLSPLASHPWRFNGTRKPVPLGVARILVPPVRIPADARSISGSTLAIFLISCVEQLPHHLQRHTALSGVRLRVGLGVA
jgi:hypothetical protein